MSQDEIRMWTEDDRLRLHIALERNEACAARVKELEARVAHLERLLDAEKVDEQLLKQVEKLKALVTEREAELGELDLLLRKAQVRVKELEDENRRLEGLLGQLHPALRVKLEAAGRGEPIEPPPGAGEGEMA